MLLAVGCAPIPKAELAAYTEAYSDSREATNGILDIVAPYERVVMRFAAGDTTPAISAPHAIAGTLPANRKVAKSAAPLPPPDPTLFDDPAVVKSSRPLPPPDPTLFADPAAVKSSRPLPPPDPTLFADPSAVKSSGPPPGSTLSVEAPTDASQTTNGGCQGIGGADAFCYNMAAAWADIGDPPLVGAYRNVSDVVLRFNDLLIAYANGIDGRLLQQDVNGLSAAASNLAPIAAVAGAGGFIAGFNGAVSVLAPIAGAAGQIADRAQLRSFLLTNYEAVDGAIAMMAVNSVELYANVAIGTNLFRRLAPPGAGQSLVARRRDIRRLIANWTVMLQDDRQLLRILRVAIATPDGLETRLNNINPAISARIDSRVIKKEITTLGTPMLAP